MQLTRASWFPALSRLVLKHGQSSFFGSVRRKLRGIRTLSPYPIIRPYASSTIAQYAREHLIEAGQWFFQADSGGLLHSCQLPEGRDG